MGVWDDSLMLNFIADWKGTISSMSSSSSSSASETNEVAFSPPVELVGVSISSIGLENSLVGDTRDLVSRLVLANLSAVSSLEGV